MLSPILEKLTADGSGVKSGTGLELDLVTIDTEAQAALAQKYQVRGQAFPSVPRL
jgi:thioredoxin 1